MFLNRSHSYFTFSLTRSNRNRKTKFERLKKSNLGIVIVTDVTQA